MINSSHSQQHLLGEEVQLVFTKDFRNALVIKKEAGDATGFSIEKSFQLAKGLRILKSHGKFLVEEGSQVIQGDIVIPARTAKPGIFDVRIVGNRIDLIGFGVSDLLDGVLAPTVSLKAHGRFDFSIETTDKVQDEFCGILIQAFESTDEAYQGLLDVKIYFQSVPPEQI